MKGVNKTKKVKKAALRHILYLSVALLLIAGLVLTAVLGFVDFWAGNEDSSPAQEVNEYLSFLEQWASSLEAVLAEDPDNPELQVELGSVYFEIAIFFWEEGKGDKGDEYAAKSEDLLLKAMEDGYQKPYVALRIALLNFYRGKDSQAERYFLAALNMDEESPETHFYYGFFLSSLQRHEEARKHFKEVLLLTGEDDYLAEAARHYLERENKGE